MRLRLALALALCGLSIATAFAQEKFPDRPITIVAPFPPGGVADLTARPVAASMEKILKNPVVVVNKTGAAGAGGMSFVANSKPDGYTLLMALSSISIIPEADKLFDRKPAYTVDQLLPLALFSADPTILAVGANHPWKSVKDLVADAKKRPGAISYSSSGIYGTLHMAMEMFAHAAGIKLNHVPYGGAWPALTARLRSGCPYPARQSRQAPRAGGLGSQARRRDAGRADVQGIRLRHRVLYLGRRVRAERHAGADYEKAPRDYETGRSRGGIQRCDGEARDADRLHGRARVSKVLRARRKDARRGHAQDRTGRRAGKITGLWRAVNGELWIQFP